MYELEHVLNYQNILMQSDGNRYNGEVVLDSINKASRDEDNI